MRIIRNVADRKSLEENERKAVSAVQVKETVEHGSVESESTAANEATEEKEAGVQAQEATEKKGRKKAKA